MLLSPKYTYQKSPHKNCSINGAVSMPQSKKPRLLEGGQNNHAAADNYYFLVASINKLSYDELATIFGFLPPKQIMRMRRVSKRWGEAVKKTTIESP